jgi:hypothetical protein
MIGEITECPCDGLKVGTGKIGERDRERDSLPFAPQCAPDIAFCAALPACPLQRGRKTVAFQPIGNIPPTDNKPAQKGRKRARPFDCIGERKWAELDLNLPFSPKVELAEDRRATLIAFRRL